tara:strand:+ start:3557 stop:4090 length:534 start_codon:yes stop_codon:yes gene_type:complete
MCELILSAFKRPCATPSGITSIIISDVYANGVAGLSFAVTSGVATITGTGGVAYRIKQDDFVSTLTQAITADKASNAFMYELSLELKLDGTSAAIGVLVQELVKGRVVAFAVYTNGDIKALGIQRGGSVTGGDAGASGTGMGDAKGATLTLTESSTIPAPNILLATIAGAFTITEPA